MITSMKSRARSAARCSTLLLCLLAMGCGDECDETYGTRCDGNRVTHCGSVTGDYSSSREIQGAPCGEGLLCSAWFGETKAICLPPGTAPATCALETVFEAPVDASNGYEPKQYEFVMGVGSVENQLFVLTAGSNEQVRLYRVPSTEEFASTERVNVDVREYVVGDSNGDGTPDIIASFDLQEGPRDGLTSWLYHGAPGDGAPYALTEDHDTTHNLGDTVAFVDLDGDGKDDWVLAGWKTIALQWGDSMGSTSLWTAPHGADRTETALILDSEGATLWTASLDPEGVLGLHRLHVDEREVHETLEISLDQNARDLRGIAAIPMDAERVMIGISTYVPDGILLLDLVSGAIQSSTFVPTLPLSHGLHAVHENGKAGFLTSLPGSYVLVHAKEGQSQVSYLLDPAVQSEDGMIRSLRWQRWPRGNTDSQPLFAAYPGVLYRVKPECL